MKNKLLIALAIMAPMAAGAATQCVALNATDTSSKNTGASEYETDWTVTEADGTIIRGIAACGSEQISFGGTAETLVLSVGTRTKCWCRMILPVASKWVYNTWYPVGGCDGDATYCCIRSCNATCASSVATSESFRSAMFNSVQL